MDIEPKRTASAPTAPSSWVGSRAEAYAAAVVVALTSLWAFILLRRMEVTADEGIHRIQVLALTSGKLEVVRGLTMLPGYHAVLALLAWVGGVQSSEGQRTLSTLLSLPAIPVFYMLARQLCSRFAVVATLQFVFLPILFPFFFVLYTDSFSLLFILLSLLLLLRQHRNAAAAVAILSVLVRQTNIIHLLFLLGLAYLEDHGLALSWERVLGFLRRHVLYVLGLAGFAVFVVLNRGVAVGDRSAHPFKLALGNVYLFLFLYFLAALPVNLAACRSALASLRDRRLLALAVVLYGVFMLTFVNDHPYNKILVEAFRATDTDHFTDSSLFLHNLLLLVATSSALMKTLFFVPVLLSVLILLRTPLVQQRFVLIYPMTLLLLTPSWLIEQRYTLVPLSLLLLARERTSPVLEYATAVLGFVASVALAYAIGHYVLFL